MAISIACSRLLLKILADFQFGVYLQSLMLNHATTHSRDRYTQFWLNLSTNKKFKILLTYDEKTPITLNHLDFFIVFK